MIPFEVHGCKVPRLKALKYGKYETRWLSCGSTSSICQEVLKSGNLLHKQGFVETQSLLNVNQRKLLIFFTLSIVKSSQFFDFKNKKTLASNQLEKIE